MAGGKFSEAQLHGMTIRESADDGSDFTNAPADYRRLFLGEDGQLHVKDSAGAVTGIGGAIADILDLDTAETDDTLVLAPDGAGGVEFRAEAGGAAHVGAKAYNSGTQTIANGTETAVTLNTDEWDSNAFHDTSTNTSRMTIPAGMGGKYLCIGKVYFAADADGYRRVGFYVNGAVSAITIVDTDLGTDAAVIIATGELLLAAGDFVEMWVQHSAGGDLAIGHASARRAQCDFSITYLGA